MYYEDILLSGRWFLFGQQTSVFVVFDCQRAPFLILSLSWKYWFWFIAQVESAIFNSFIILGLNLLCYIHIISSGLYRECVYKTQPNAETQHQHCNMVRGYIFVVKILTFVHGKLYVFKNNTWFVIVVIEEKEMLSLDGTMTIMAFGYIFFE